MDEAQKRYYEALRKENYMLAQALLSLSDLIKENMDEYPDAMALLMVLEITDDSNTMH